MEFILLLKCVFQFYAIPIRRLLCIFGFHRTVRVINENGKYGRGCMHCLKFIQYPPGTASYSRRQEIDE